MQVPYRRTLAALMVAGTLLSHAQAVVPPSAPSKVLHPDDKKYIEDTDRLLQQSLALHASMQVDHQKLQALLQKMIEQLEAHRRSYAKEGK